MHLPSLLTGIFCAVLVTASLLLGLWKPWEHEAAAVQETASEPIHPMRCQAALDLRREILVAAVSNLDEGPGEAATTIAQQGEREIDTYC
jgi:hypothetical protein